MSESTKVTKKRKRENTISDYFTLDSESKASSSEETAKFDLLPANTYSKIADPLKAYQPSNPAL